MGTLCFREFFAQYLTCISVRSRCCGDGTATTRTGWGQRHNKAVGGVLETSQAGTWANPGIRECKGVGGISLSTGSFWPWRWWSCRFYRCSAFFPLPWKSPNHLAWCIQVLKLQGQMSQQMPWSVWQSIRPLIHNNLSVCRVHPLNAVSQMSRTTAQADGVCGTSSALK